MVDCNLVFIGPGKEVFLRLFDSKPYHSREAKGREKGEVDLRGLARAVKIFFDHAEVDRTDQFPLHNASNSLPAVDVQAQKLRKACALAFVVLCHHQSDAVDLIWGVSGREL